MSEIVVQSEFMRQAYNRGDTIKKIGNNKYKCVALICNEPTINEHVYSDQLVRKFINSIQSDINNRKVFGVLGLRDPISPFPIKDASFIITSAGVYTYKLDDNIGYQDRLEVEFEPIDTVSGRILHYLCEETVIGNTGCSSIVIRTGAIGDISNDNKITFIESMCFYADFYYSAIPAHQA